MKKAWLYAWIAFPFLWSFSHSLRITEIFWRFTPYYRSEERYIELWNDTDSSVELSRWKIVLPLSATADQADFFEAFSYPVPGVVCGSTLLPPGGRAVVLAEGAGRFAGLLPVSRGALIVKPARKGGFISSWEGKLSRIRLIDPEGGIAWDGSAFAYCTNGLTNGLSLGFDGTAFRAVIPSPGGPNEGEICAVCPIIGPGKGAVLRVHSHETPSVIVLTPEGTSFPVSMSPKGGDLWEAYWLPHWAPEHGELVEIDAGSNRVFLRYLDGSVSPNAGRVILNEAVPTAVRDWSSTWDGQTGSGSVSETDDWLELVNSGVPDYIVGTNHFLLVRSNGAEDVHMVTCRFSSATMGKSGQLPPGGYLVFTADGGLPRAGEVILYEGYPYRDGVPVSGISWEAPHSLGPTNEAIHRVPNGCALPCAEFRRGEPTFARANSDVPELFCPSIARGSSTQVFLVDPGRNSFAAAVRIRSPRGETELTLTNARYYFAASLNLLPADSGVLPDGIPVGNGERVDVEYPGESGKILAVASFRFALPGWELPRETADLTACTVYPNPMHAGTATLRVANVPANASAKVISPNGAIVAELICNEKGAMEWKTVICSGIYSVIVKSGAETVVRRLLVY
jgi:hypothetical protein